MSTPVYQDPAAELYQEFIQIFKSAGVRWHFAMQEGFRHTPPENILRLVHLLPLGTHSRVMLMPSEEQLEKHLQQLKSRPGFSNRQLDVITIRDVINRFFLIYQDDEVRFKISYGRQVITEYQGLIKDFQIQAKDLLKPEFKIQVGDLFTLECQLLNAGAQRLKEETRAQLTETAILAEQVMNLEPLEIALAKLSDERLAERLQLFGVQVPAGEAPQPYLLEIKPTNFGSTNLVAIEDINEQLGSEVLTNQEVLAYLESPRLVEIAKMREWLAENHL